MSLTSRELKRPDAALMSMLSPSLLRTLATLDRGLPPPRTTYSAKATEADEPEPDLPVAGPVVPSVAEECRASLMRWCEEAMRHEGMAPAHHHRVLIEHLQAVVDARIPRLMIFMPPGSAKSTYTSQLLPAWFMAHKPGEPVLAASHTRGLAMRFSGRVQRYIRAFGDLLGYGLETESRERWEATNGSEYMAAGVGGAIPGYRAGLFIVDDPIKGRENADSEVQREKVWDWWNGDVPPRLKPGAGIILMHTRWHEDDLAGRLLATEPERWHVLKIQAVAEEVPDPLGRSMGEPLWADDSYGYGAMILREHDALIRRGASREWASQYQQNPRPLEGSLFKVHALETLDVAPNVRGAHIARGWDLAATKKMGTNDPDWTVGVKMARLRSGQYVVLDVVRLRGGPDQVDAAIRNVADQDGPGVTISLPEDPGQAGKTQALAMMRMLSGHRVQTSRETGDKATRASPFISQVNGGNVAMVKAGWNAAYRDELAAFPSGTKDDQVDASSRAFGVIGLSQPPLIISPDVMQFLARR